MKRLCLVAAGFVLGWVGAFAHGVLASKGFFAEGPIVKRLIKKFGPDSGISPDKRARIEQETRETIKRV